MVDVFCEVAGKPALSLHILIPNKGAWYADAEIGAAVSLSGRVEIVTLELAGSDPVPGL